MQQPTATDFTLIYRRRWFLEYFRGVAPEHVEMATWGTQPPTDEQVEEGITANRLDISEIPELVAVGRFNPACQGSACCFGGHIAAWATRNQLITPRDSIGMLINWDQSSIANLLGFVTILDEEGTGREVAPFSQEPGAWPTMMRTAFAEVREATNQYLDSDESRAIAEKAAVVAFLRFLVDNGDDFVRSVPE